MAQTSIRVVAAVIQQGGKYLITQRREHASLPLLWEFPGGRVEPGETDEQALKREFKERLGADIKMDKPVAFRQHEYEGYAVELVLYEATLVNKELEPKRVKEYRWGAADEFSQYPFPPADTASMDDDFQVFLSAGKPKKPPQA